MIYKSQSGAVFDILHYQSDDGIDIVSAWLEELTEADACAASRVLMRINRVRSGNLGDHKPVGGGVWELRIDYGPGYRVYYALAGRHLVLLLCGGDKRKQGADIQRAIALWQDYNSRK